MVEVATVAAVLAAVLGGGPVATAVLRAADPAAVGVAGGPQDPTILRGGAWIGVLERAAVAAALLAGSAEGLAVVLAVKGLGRFAELRAPAAAERFIVGTLASGLWAAACVGVAAPPARLSRRPSGWLLHQRVCRRRAAGQWRPEPRPRRNT